MPQYLAFKWLMMRVYPLIFKNGKQVWKCPRLLSEANDLWCKRWEIGYFAGYFSLWKRKVGKREADRLILIGIEGFSASHCNPNRMQTVKNFNGVALIFQYF